ncbi:unnamed protein product [Ceratitis capitata]|uniref:(Mediterranean fruit fly) hypothetical protein n=1 Tax=Ceratitis capitata TaxID=7213 RepID=A0A811VM71_CERCA|nr:unnamed protein product [Ceratitis capitata]
MQLANFDRYRAADSSVLLSVSAPIRCSAAVNGRLARLDADRRFIVGYKIGAERKTRDEERRAAKRKMTATGRKKLDELYHPVTDRSEFYTMQDLQKPPVYSHPPMIWKRSQRHITILIAWQKVAAPTLKFHNHFPPDVQTDKKDHLLDQGLVPSAMGDYVPPLKRGRMTPPTSERVMLFVRQENEDIYTPLHGVPPTTIGLLNAIESKYKISTASIIIFIVQIRKGLLRKLTMT